MYLTVYRPSARVAARRASNSLIDSVFSDFFTPLFAPVDQGASEARIGLVEKADRFEVSAEVPGVKKEDIDVKIEGAVVRITAKSEAADELKDGERVIYSERRATSYARSFELPAEVVQDAAQASYENGVLKLVLPKKAALEARRLTVN